MSVVIPARNEADTLPHLLSSLAAQHDPPGEVIVVDDDSVDATAAVALTWDARIVRAGPLPPGWAGKPWACWTGAQHSVGSTLVFLDADTKLAHDGLVRLVAAHAAHASEGLLSVQPFHDVQRAYEQLSAFPNAVSMMGAGVFAVGGTRMRRAMAFGPCLVTRRASYAAVGGHAAVRSRIVEDIHLARAYARAGRPVRCLTGGTAVAFRMYPDGPRQLIEGWTKNLADGSRLAPPLAALGAAAWVSACAAATVGSTTVAIAAATGRPAEWWWLGAAALVSTQLAWMLRRVGNFRAWTWILFPIPLAAFLALFAWSAFLHFTRRPKRWRGRRIHSTRGA